MNKPYTINIDENEKFVDMTDALPSGTELKLVKYRVKLDLTTILANIPDALYVSIGNSCVSGNIVDDIRGSNRIALALDNRFINSSNVSITLESGNDDPLSLIGQLGSSYYVRVFYKDGTLVPNTVLKNLFLKFRYN